MRFATHGVTLRPMVISSPLCKNGPSLSQLAYGTWRILEDPALATPAAILGRLQRCRDLGITTIDTAEIYGGYDVEEALGRALALDPGLRAQLQIVTKCGIYVPNTRHPDRRVAFYNARADRLQKSVEKSLRLLGTDHVDVFLVHRPDWLTGAEDTASGLDRLIKDGKIRAAGVSNYNVHQVSALNARMAHPMATNQVELSLFAQGALFDGTLDQCQQLGIRPMAWSPLGGGRLWTDTGPAALRIRDALNTLVPRYDGASPMALALAWVMAHPSRPVTVFATNRIDRLDDAAQAARITLHREDWYLLWEAAHGSPIP